MTLVSYFKKKILPHGILNRFILIILLPILVLQAIVLIFFFDRHWDTISHRLASDVAGEINVVAETINEGALEDEDIRSLLHAMSDSLSLKMSFIPNGQLDTTIRQQKERETKAMISALKKLPYSFTIHELDDSKTKISIDLDKGILETVVPRKRFFSSTVYVFLIWMFVSSILLSLVAFLFMKNQVRSIVRLSHAAEAFGRGQRLENFKPEGATEVRQAGMSFIQMRNRIQRYLTERTGMLSGVSHDLRTPLTRMRLQLSMLPKMDGLSDLQGDVAEMEHMLEAYLSFARGDGKEDTAPLSLNQTLQELAEKSERAGQPITLHLDKDLSCIGRSNELKRALTNIITNATRYAKQVEVKLDTYRKMARLTIDDNGPGIPKAKRAEVFKAFYRLNGSPSGSSTGVGLGLTIARDIILSHGGEIELSDSPLGGLRVTVLLPLGTVGNI